MSINSIKPDAPLENLKDPAVSKATGTAGKLKKACSEFEGVLLNFMFQSMKKTVGQGGVFSNGYQKQMYESIFFEEISMEFAREKGIGIGAALYRQISGDRNLDKPDERETDKLGRKI
ncbi:MAG: rod-binding protein [Deltaproteobacteria bacterium]|nr:rod-binding protein [Deltaproteobacteria bacterium]